MEAPLQKGEIISRQDRQGIVVLKWKDARDVRLLSTKHAPMLINVRPRGEQEQEPQAELAHGKQSRTSTGIMRPGPSHGKQPKTSTDITKPQHRQRRISRRAEKKPIGIIACNKGKIGIDILDQMASYETALLKGIKW